MADNALYNKIGGSKINSGVQDFLNKKAGDSNYSGTAQSAIRQYVSEKPPAPLDYSGGGGGGKSTSSNTATTQAVAGGGFDLAGYLAQINAERQAAAEAAYDKARSALNNAYGEASSAYQNIYKSGEDQLGRSYDNSRGKINSEATDAFRQAYVNRMLSEKNLGQRMAAMGMSGGAAESTLAGLINNYGNSRNSIQRTLDTNLGDLEMNYQGNLADLYNAYQSQMAGLASQRASQLAQLEMNLANQIASSGGDYFSALMSNSNLLKNAMTNAVNAQNAYVAPETAQATNAYNPASVQQANDIGGTLTNWDAWQKQLDALSQNGSNGYGIIANMKDSGISPDALSLYLASAGLGK